MWRDEKKPDNPGGANYDKVLGSQMKNDRIKYEILILSYKNVRGVFRV